MKKDKRSLFTTIVASLLGLAILIFALLLLPLKNVSDAIFFGVGMLLVVLCIITAIAGKKGTIKDILYSLLSWS